MKIRKLVSLLVIMTVLLQLTNINIYASNQEADSQDIIFVLDRSGSMKSKDSNNLSNELVKMYIDTLDSENTNIGLIGFNDTIVSSLQLTNLSTVENRNNLKDTVNQMQIKGNTDIGFALKEATLMLENSNANEKIIVLLSDGETDLNASSIRTLEDSKSDESFAISTAIDNGYSIYTVGVNVSDITYLEDISEKTNGITYQMDSTSDLYKVFESLSNEGINKGLKVLDTITINGVAENVSLKIPNEYVKENNMIIAYNNPLSSIEASKYEIYKSHYYSSLRFVENEKDTIDFKLVSNGNTQIHIYYNLISSLEPIILTPQKINETDYNVVIKVFDSNTNEEVSEEYYKKLEGSLVINENGDIEETLLKQSDDGLITTINIDSNNQQNTDIYATINNGESIVYSETLNLSVANNQPKLKVTEPTEILLNEEQKELDLTEYFSDEDSSNLNYQIVSINDSYVENIEINNNTLIFNTIREGIEDIEIVVTDNDGGYTRATVSLTVMPFWIYYKETTMMMGLIFIILLLIGVLLVRRKDKKVVIATKEDEADTYIPQSKNFFKDGRLEGYFLCTKSGKDYPALFWNENHLANKSLITLGELLSFMEVDESLMESRKIFFEATDKEQVTFWHRTRCTIYLNNREIENGRQVKLSYDDKMYIVFEDGETEIEVRFKRVMKKNFV